MQQIQFVGITPNSLVDQFDLIVDKKIKELIKLFQPKEPTVYLTRQEVANMLKIDLSSVHNWTKKGILQAYQIGGRVYYKRAQIENAIIKLDH